MPTALLALTLSILTLIRPPSIQMGAPDPGPFTLSVLRDDGLALPFAAFDDGKWASPWPRDVRFVDLPLGLEDVPEKWWGKTPASAGGALWTDGRPARPVRFEAPGMVRIACGRRLGVRSDYRSTEPLPMSFEQPYPKAGLVVSGAQRVDPIEVIGAGTPDRAYIGDMLTDEFDRAEQTAITSFMAWKHPVARAARRRVALEIEALYRAPMDTPGWTAYYVEAVKRYPLANTGGCGLVTFVSGWIGVDDRNHRSFSVTGRIAYCDRYRVSYVLPLGRMTLDRKTYWIYQRAGYDEEFYAVSRPTPKRTDHLVVYQAAACPGIVLDGQAR